MGSEGRGYLWKADDKNEDDEEQRQSLWGEKEFSVINLGMDRQTFSVKQLLSGTLIIVPRIRLGLHEAVWLPDNGFVCGYERLHRR